MGCGGGCNLHDTQAFDVINRKGKNMVLGGRNSLYSSIALKRTSLLQRALSSLFGRILKSTGQAESRQNKTGNSLWSDYRLSGEFGLYFESNVVLNRIAQSALHIINSRLTLECWDVLGKVNVGKRGSMLRHQLGCLCDCPG